MSISLDLASYVSGVNVTALFTPGVGTPATFAGPHTGMTDGVSVATSSRNMAEIYNRLNLQIAATIVNSGLTYDPTNWAQLATAVSRSVPAGAIFDYAGATAPAGFLLCDGSAYARVGTYANLYAALGGASSPWGQGDGSTTFNVPNLQRKVTMGAGGTAISGPANTVGATGGAEAITIATANLPAHSHSFSNVLTGYENQAHSHYDNGHAHGFAYPINTQTYAGGNGAAGFSGGYNNVSMSGTLVSYASLSTESASHNHYVSGTTDGGTGGGAAITNVQPTTVVNKIIKY